MSDKFVAGIVTVAVISPICSVCILGPAAIGSLFAGALGWLGGFGQLTTLALMAAAGGLVYRHFLRRGVREQTIHGETSESGSLARITNVGRSPVPDGQRDLS